MTDRMQRINELLRQELSQLIEHDSEELGMVTIVDVSTSRDLANARVAIAPLSSLPLEQLLVRLQRHAHEYRRILGKRLDLRKIPDFEFQIDEASEQLNRVEALLDELERAKKV